MPQILVSFTRKPLEMLSRRRRLVWGRRAKFSINIPIRILVQLQNRADRRGQPAYVLIEQALLRASSSRRSFPAWSSRLLARELENGTKKKTSMITTYHVWRGSRLRARERGISLEEFVALSIVLFGLGKKEAQQIGC